MMRTLPILLACLVATAAVAADNPRKIDFTTVLLDADEAPIQECTDPVSLLPTDPACKSKRTITLGLVAERALVAPEQGLSPEDSLSRGVLALRVLHDNGAVLKVDELALIKKRIAAIYGPLIVARSFPLLDPAETK
jgi:hypothetical protein